MTPEQEGRARAQAFREEHNLGFQPLGDLVAMIEETTGHDVAIIQVETDEHGLTMHDPVRRVTFVAAATTPHPMRQRSTLSHELAHVLFEDWSLDDPLGERTPAERRADSFARHLLVPQEGLNGFLGDRRDLTVADLSRVVQHFLASPIIVTIALHDAGFITAEQKAEWKGYSTPELALRYGWIDQYRSLAQESQRTRSPQQLLARATNGYIEGVVSLQTIATLRGVDSETALSELTEAGVTPVSWEPEWLAADELPGVDVDLAWPMDEPPGDPNE